MFFLKKLISIIILPPGSFVFLLLASSIWLVRKRRRLAAAINCFLALSIWLAATPWMGGHLLRSLEKEWHIPQTVKGDVIILLGGGIYPKAADLSGTGVPSEDMFGRIVTAARLQKKTGLPIIVSGGAVFEFSDPEAPVIKRILVDLGVEPQKIYTEEKSRDTLENARFSMAICKREGFTSPVLVTSAYHLRRSVNLFRSQGAKVSPYPAFFRTSSDRRLSWIDFAPAAGALNLTSTAMREYLGLAFYRLFPPS